ncbi:MAG: di-heme oxidoredictase family protein [Betaproteobacteria bacterium]
MRVWMAPKFRWAIAAGVLVSAGMALGEDPAGGLSDDELSAGQLTIARYDEHAFDQAPVGMAYRPLQKFLRGRHHFNQRWVQFPSIGGDWGLGPTFITNKCVGCHVRAGRGAPPEKPDEQVLSVLVRISIPGENAFGGPKPHPVYGDQIQNRGLMGQDRDDTFLGERVTPEAEVFLDWETSTVAFADGEQVELRKPKVRWGRLWFGPIGDDTMISLRMAQPIQGLGLLEAIPEATILKLAEAQKLQGLNGRPNWVRDDINDKTALGRFGWKANQPSVGQQIASAYAGDLGVTSSLYLEQNCPGPQTDCAAQPPGNQPELIDSDWNEIMFWEQGLAVPARRDVRDPRFALGGELFVQAQCAACHVPELQTADNVPHLKLLQNQKVRAYTDLLIHDMGEGLADGRPDFKAGGRDWRTQPLWGLGLAGVVSGAGTPMLHDGRARNATEAILWHGGEAEAAKEIFRNMPKHDREMLLFYLQSI